LTVVTRRSPKGRRGVAGTPAPPVAENAVTAAAGAATVTATLRGKQYMTVDVDGHSFCGASFTPSNFASPDIASHDFENGVFSPFSTSTPNAVFVVDDPTPRASGKVVQINYIGTQDVNRAFKWIRTGTYNTPGTSFFVRGKLYLPYNPTWPTNMRKLLYINASSGISGAPNAVVKSRNVNASGQAILQSENYPKTVTGGSQLSTHGAFDFDTWVTLEAEVLFNSAVDVADGGFRVWIDGVLVHERLNFYPWLRSLTGGAGIKTMYFGHQWEGGATDTVNESRYWDDCAISSQRIGP
jgi:hypothetical protein